MAEYTMVNPFVEVKNGAISLKSVIIKWKGQLTRVFFSKERRRKQPK